MGSLKAIYSICITAFYAYCTQMAQIATTDISDYRHSIYVHVSQQYGPVKLTELNQGIKIS